MLNKFPALLLALTMALSANTHAAGAADAHHSHDHGGAATTLRLNDGKPWPTDEPLRRAMGEINQAMARALPAIHRQQFGDGEYQALAATVHERVAYMVDHCKLDAQADAMLHLVIAELLAGAEIMDGKTASPRHDGAVRVRAALKSYGKYFRHPGWVTAKG